MPEIDGPATDRLTGAVRGLATTIIDLVRIEVGRQLKSPPQVFPVLPKSTDRIWLTPIEAGKVARCSSGSILDALRSQELRGYQAGGKHGRWRIHVDDLDAWIRGEVADVQVPRITRRKL